MKNKNDKNTKTDRFNDLSEAIRRENEYVVDPENDLGAGIFCILCGKELGEEDMFINGFCEECHALYIDFIAVQARSLKRKVFDKMLERVEKSIDLEAIPDLLEYDKVILLAAPSRQDKEILLERVLQKIQKAREEIKLGKKKPKTTSEEFVN